MAVLGQTKDASILLHETCEQVVDFLSIYNSRISIYYERKLSNCIIPQEQSRILNTKTSMSEFLIDTRHLYRKTSDFVITQKQTRNMNTKTSRSKFLIDTHNLSALLCSLQNMNQLGNDSRWPFRSYNIQHQFNLPGNREKTYQLVLVINIFPGVSRKILFICCLLLEEISQSFFSSEQLLRGSSGGRREKE